MESWAEYFELSKNRGPNPLLENALKLVVNRGQALDLGAGSLKDSKFMLSMGFKKVTAVEADPGARKYRDKIPASQLTLKITPFEKLKLPSKRFDFISAQYALPFTEPPHLPQLIDQIIASLNPCGIFCAQFFGPKDTWAESPNPIAQNMTFFSKTQLLRLLKPLDLIYFKESIKPGRTIDNTMKTWHLFEVIAIKNHHLRKRR